MISHCLFRGIAGAFTLVMLTVVSVLGQNFTNNGTWTNNGTASYNNFTNSATGTATNNATLRIRGTLTNNNAAANFDTQSGTVDYRGLNVAQTITSNVSNSRYGALMGQRGGTKTLGGNIEVTGVVTVSDLATGNATTLAVGTATLTVTAAGSPFSIDAGDNVTSAATGTINYAGAVQNVEPLNYGNLTVSAAGVKTLLAGTTGVAGNFTISAGSVNARVNATTVDYNGSGAQNVATVDYRHLTFSNSGTKTFAGGTTRIDGNFTLGGLAAADARTNSSGIEFDAAGAQTIAAIDYHDITLATSGAKTFASGTTRVRGLFDITGIATANLTANTTTFEYDGAAQTVRGGAGLTYHNLLTSNSGVKTASGNVTISNNFDNGGGANNAVTFDMGSNILALGVGTTDNTSATIQFGGAANGLAINSGTIEYNGSGVQTVATGTYAAMMFSNGGVNAKSIGGATTATALVTVNSGATLFLSSTLDATLASGTGFSNAGTLNVLGIGTLNLTADLVNDGTITNDGTIQVGTD